MYTISDKFQTYLDGRSRDWLVKVNIAGTDYGSSAIVDFEVDNAIVSGEEFEVGTVIISKLTLRLKTNDDIPANARVMPYVSLTGAQGAAEWLPMGEFYVDTRSQINDKVWTFTCYDKLVRSDVAYVSALSYPATMQAVWNEVCDSLEYVYDGSVQIDASYMVPTAPTGYTKRQVLGHIAAAHGASVYVDRWDVVRWARFGGEPEKEYALSFDGVDDYVEIPRISEVTKNGLYTIEMWIKFDDVTTAQTIFDCGNGSDDRNGFSVSAGQLSFGYYNGSTYLRKSGAVVTDRWYHVAGVNNSGTVQLFINGVEQSGSAQPLLNGGTFMRLGSSTANVRFFNGMVDDFRIWNVARTQEQIQANMHRRLSGREAGLVGYWRFDENGLNPITATFAGKVAGSTVENPNIYKATANPALQAPSGSWNTTDDATINYERISALDGNTRTVTTSTNTAVSQLLSSFNALEETLREHGNVFGSELTSERVTWLKNNVQRITGSLWARGTGPSGNKVSLHRWNALTSSWSLNNSHTSGAITKISTGPSLDWTSWIDLDGKVHLLANSDASNGTVASTIYTDYVELVIDFKNTAIDSSGNGNNGTVYGASYVEREQQTQVEILASEYIRAKQTNPIKSFTRVVVVYDVDDGLAYEAGTGDENHTLYVDCPYGTQAMANALLEQFDGFYYTPTELEARGMPQLEPGDLIQYGRFVDTPTWDEADVTWDDVNYSWDGWTQNGRMYALQLRYAFKGGLKMWIDAPSKSEVQSEFALEGSLTQQINRLNSNAVKLGRNYFGLTVTKEQGLKIQRGDGKSELTLNSDELDWKVNGVSSLHYDAIAERLKFTGTLEGVDGEFSGTITATAGFIGGWTIEEDGLASAEPGVYPRIEMNSGGDLLAAYSSSTDYVAMIPNLSGAPVYGIYAGGLARFTMQYSAAFMETILAAVGDLQLSTSGDISLFPGSGGLVRFGDWSEIWSSGDAQSLQTALNNLSSQIAALTTALAGKATAGSSTGGGGAHNHGIAPGTQLMVAGGGTVTWVAASDHSHVQNS